MMKVNGPTTDEGEIRRWADAHGRYPFESMPSRVDGEPALVQLLSMKEAAARKDFAPISWAYFCSKLKVLGLASSTRILIATSCRLKANHRICPKTTGLNR